MTRYAQIYLPAQLLEEALGKIRRFHDKESILYLAGKEQEDSAIITRVIEPAAIRYKRLVFVPAEEVARVIDDVFDHDEILVAQLHSHPKNEDHSETDDCGTISKREGFVSLVVPFYGQFSTREYPHWFGYELQDQQWFEFDQGRIQII